MEALLHIKNMVCDRCIEAVAEELEIAGIAYEAVRLGAITGVTATEQQITRLSQQLGKRGFQLLQDSNEQLVSQIKTAILRSVQDPALLENQNHSTYLERTLGKDYTTLSRVFSAFTGSTLEKHIINQRVERAKELISYGELSVSQIANLLGYSSVQHLSTQFKKIVGQTPSQYLRSARSSRIGLDQV